MTFFKKLPFVLCLFATSLLFASEAGYTLIEDKATLLLLSPSFAERRVAKIQLDNGLKAYLVSDPGAEESAASLTVEVGSWHDPVEYPGMAHFLEHMLFMGTAKYPDEREYWQFCLDHGGSINAFTCPDRTAYLLAIKHNAFEPALERFSHFFIDPLLSTSCIDRELHAVDQEHSKNIESDHWRRWMILKETGNPDHPNALFSTGNAATLSGIPQSELKKWMQAHYSASAMHLVMVSNLSIDRLITLTKENFSKVPSFPAAKNHFEMPLTSLKQRGHITYIAPVKDLRKLSLTWELPAALFIDLESHPQDLIRYALAYKGEGGLLDALKADNLAEDIAIENDRVGQHAMMFDLSIDLTHTGLAQVDTVIERTFQAIARLKSSGIPPKLFQELKQLATLNYQYQSREDAFESINRQAFAIIDEDLATYPEKSLIPTSYNPAALSALIEHLSPQNCLITLIADPELTGVATTHKERWMGAPYTQKEIAKAKLLSWAEARPHPAIRLPDANPYIPSNLALKKPAASAPSYKKPTLIHQQADGKVYFAQDTKYLVPEAACIFDLKSPLIDGSPKQAMLLDLFLTAFEDHILSERSYGENAGFSLKTGTGDLSLRLYVSGFSDKAPLLLRQITTKLKTFTPTQEQYHLAFEELKTAYENKTKALPISQASERVLSLITTGTPLAQEKLKELKELTYDDFSAYTKALFTKLYINGSIYGNLTQSEASEVWTEVKTLLAAEPYPLQDLPKKQVISFPQGAGPHLITEATERQGNGALLLVDQGESTFEKRGAQEILSSALMEGFFNTLRTKQQTGYIAKSWDEEIEHHLFQFFAVQSSTHSTSELLARFELFLEDFIRDFEINLSSERFERIRAAKIAELEQSPENMSSMAALLHTLAFKYDGQFDFKAKRIEGLKALNYQRIKEGAKSWFGRTNRARLALLMEGVAPAENPFRYQVVSAEELSAKSSYIAWK